MVRVCIFTLSIFTKLIPAQLLFLLEKCHFCYPPDGDISIGVYDLMIRNVSWRTEGNSFFECQIPRFEKRSIAAKITVLGIHLLVSHDFWFSIYITACSISYVFAFFFQVPPRYVEITPTSETGVIVLRRDENVTLTCTSGYTSPSVAISWFIGVILYTSDTSWFVEHLNITRTFVEHFISSITERKRRFHCLYTIYVAYMDTHCVLCRVIALVNWIRFLHAIFSFFRWHLVYEKYLSFHWEYNREWQANESDQNCFNHLPVIVRVER